MKKYIIGIVTLVVILCAGKINAQEFRYGPMVGVAFSDLEFKQDLITVDSKMGATAGIATELMFPGIGFGIDAGLLYSMKGASLNLGEKKIWASEGYGNERSYLHYVEIPINLRFKYTNLNGFEEYLAPFVFAGPSISILVAHSDIPALEYSGGELGLTVGLGFEIYRKWQISGGYNWGMTYALKTRLLDDFSAKNRSWNVRVAYLF